MQTLYHLFFWLKNKQNLIQSIFSKATSYFIVFNIQTSAVWHLSKETILKTLKSLISLKFSTLKICFYTIIHASE